MALWGFTLQLFACFSLALASSLQASPPLQFSCFCAILFSLQCGVNLSTYTLPAELFPAAVRSTLFGLSAACGKLGAFIGSYAFGPIQEAVGLHGVYFVCAGVSALGLLVTLTLVPRADGLDSRVVERAERLLAAAPLQGTSVQSDAPHIR